MQHGFAVLAALFLSGSALAQVTQVPPFSGQASEGFEYYNAPFRPCIEPPVLAGEADVCGPINDSVINGFNTATWINCGGPTQSCYVYPRSGLRELIATEAWFEISFHLPVTRVGGWFAHTVDCDQDGDRFEFFGSNDQLLHTEIVALPYDCAYHWFGWQSSGAPIHRVRWSTTHVGFPPTIVLDDLQVDFITPSYCVAGVTSSGCSANIAASANPSVGYTQPCMVSVTGVEGQRSGTIFYGLEALQYPWCSGGSSSLCVAIPVQRTGAQSSGGTSGSCDGNLALDWNAFQLGTSGALGSPWLVGERAYLQAWFRDPPSCKGTALSNAYYITYMP